MFRWPILGRLDMSQGARYAMMRSGPRHQFCSRCGRIHGWLRTCAMEPEYAYTTVLIRVYLIRVVRLIRRIDQAR